MDTFEAGGTMILGSLMLEPLVMGAGGMILVDPLFQRLLVQVRLSFQLPSEMLIFYSRAVLSTEDLP